MEDKISKMGTRIKYIRENSDMTQRELAYRICVDRTTLAHYESGSRIPSIDMLWRIADVFGISVDELVGRE